MVYDREGLERNAAYVSIYEKCCQPYQVKVDTVLDHDVRRRIFAGERPLCAFVRTIRPELTRFLEEHKIPVFNSSYVSSICNHKGRTLACLKNKVLCVPSITLGMEELPYVLNLNFVQVCRYFRSRFECSSFREYESEIIEQAKDFVLKTVDGHGGNEVFSLMGEREKLRLAVKNSGRKEESDFVLQPMLRYGEESRDMRVYVIGKHIVAAVMRSSLLDFRANFSLGGQARHVELEPQQRSVVKHIIDEFDFGMVGIDFLFDRENRLVLNEIEDVVGARMLYACMPETDIVQKYVAYVMEQKLKIV